ncbi:hypothetical protein DYB31_000328 [Aphanomyces astaci]|uniref:START domain-containing protein n=1 Tax=Aphanomyces astaci TaxID=112090 RepID=A0A397FIG3_APHAT|nr:hypothetical protein DYB31_000328 [Aphanomyces astaci]
MDNSVDADMALLDEFLLDDGSLCEEIFLPSAAVAASATENPTPSPVETSTPPPPSAASSGAAKSSRSADEPASSSGKRGRRNRVYMKDELEYLRAKHDELVAQIDALNAAAVPPPSIWAQRAKDQAHEAQRVLQENTRLKEALDEQIKVVAALHRIFSKKPRLAVFPSNSSGDLAEWKLAKLGSSGRRDAMKRLLDHQFAAMESQWIRNDVYAATAMAAPGAAVKKAFVRSGSLYHDVLVVHFVQCSTWSAPFTTVADVLWDMVSVKVKIEFANQYVSEVRPVHNIRLRMITSSIGYFHIALFSATLPQPDLPAVDGRLASKRFVSSNRVVIVYRSILDDVLLPHDSRHLQDNQSGWVVVEPWGDNGTKLSILTCQTPPLAPSQSIQAGTMSEYMIGMFTQNAAAFDNAIATALAWQHMSSFSTRFLPTDGIPAYNALLDQHLGHHRNYLLGSKASLKLLQTTGAIAKVEVGTSADQYVVYVEEPPVSSVRKPPPASSNSRENPADSTKAFNPNKKASSCCRYRKSKKEGNSPPSKQQTTDQTPEIVDRMARRRLQHSASDTSCLLGAHNKPHRLKKPAQIEPMASRPKPGCSPFKKAASEASSSQGKPLWTTTEGAHSNRNDQATLSLHHGTCKPVVNHLLESDVAYHDKISRFKAQLAAMADEKAVVQGEIARLRKELRGVNAVQENDLAVAHCHAVVQHRLGKAQDEFMKVLTNQAAIRTAIDAARLELLALAQVRRKLEGDIDEANTKIDAALARIETTKAIQKNTFGELTNLERQAEADAVERILKLLSMYQHYLEQQADTKRAKAELDALLSQARTVRQRMRQQQDDTHARKASLLDRIAHVKQKTHEYLDPSRLLPGRIDTFFAGIAQERIVEFAILSQVHATQANAVHVKVQAIERFNRRTRLSTPTPDHPSPSEPPIPATAIVVGPRVPSSLNPPCPVSHVAAPVVAADPSHHPIPRSFEVLANAATLPSMLSCESSLESTVPLSSFQLFHRALRAHTYPNNHVSNES